MEREIKHDRHAFFSFEGNRYRANMTLNKLRGGDAFPRLPIKLPDGRFVVIETVRMSMPPSIGSVEVTQDLVQDEYAIAKLIPDYC